MPATSFATCSAPRRFRATHSGSGAFVIIADNLLRRKNTDFAVTLKRIHCIVFWKRNFSTSCSVSEAMYCSWQVRQTITGISSPRPKALGIRFISACAPQTGQIVSFIAFHLRHGGSTRSALLASCDELRSTPSQPNSFDSSPVPPVQHEQDTMESENRRSLMAMARWSLVTRPLGLSLLHGPPN